MATGRWLIAGLALSLMGCLGSGSDSRTAGPGYGGGSYYRNTGYSGGDRWTAPRPGISCDRAERVCYDRGGPELSVTREYFGGDAARRLENEIGGNWKKDDVYNPQRGVRCDVDDELCQKKGQDDYQSTRQQFGRAAGQQVREPDGTIQPNKKTVCDPADQTCLTKGQIDVNQTRYVFGGQAAKDARKEKQAQQAAERAARTKPGRNKPD